MMPVRCSSVLLFCLASVLLLIVLYCLNSSSLDGMTHETDTIPEVRHGNFQAYPHPLKPSSAYVLANRIASLNQNVIFIYHHLPHQFPM